MVAHLRTATGTYIGLFADLRCGCEADVVRKNELLVWEGLERGNAHFHVDFHDIKRLGHSLKNIGRKFQPVGEAFA